MSEPLEISPPPIDSQLEHGATPPLRYSERKEIEEKGRLLSQAEKEAENKKPAA